MSSFSLNGIPARYRQRRDSEPKSWYAKRDRGFYGGVPKVRRQFYKRPRVLALFALVLLFLFVYSNPFGGGRTRGGSAKRSSTNVEVDVGIVEQGGPELEGVPAEELEFVRRMRSPHLNGYTALSDAKKQERVRETFRTTWHAYTKSAWGMDEFYPKTKSGRHMVDGGLGWIIVDALDTMHLMGLTEELAQAKRWATQELSYDIDHDVNVFETTIRMLGGLLSIFHLTKDKAYLNQAVDLGNRLLKGYQTESGMPTSSVNLHTGEPIPNHTDNGASSVAEVTTLQLEMRYLSHLTGDPSYGEAAELAMQKVLANERPGGLVPIMVSPITGEWHNSYLRLGSRADSYYEYLAKQWLMFGEDRYRVEWERSVDGVKRYLVRKTGANGLTYVGELPDGVDGVFSPKMDHLVCYYPGTLALAATRGLSLQKAKQQAWWTRRHDEDMDLAVELTRTCFEMYNSTRSGLASEITHFNDDPTPNQDPGTLMPDMEIHTLDKHNIQRPETVESLFVMWRVTRDERYRRWAWQIFVAMERWFAVVDGDGDKDGSRSLGHTSLSDVTVVPPPQRDNMESFWLAETLKYLYLTFSSERDERGLGLDEVVFNTEAHPLPVLAKEATLDAAQEPTWKKMQKKVESRVEEDEEDEDDARARAINGGGIVNSRPGRRSRQRVFAGEEDSSTRSKKQEMTPERRQHIDDLKLKQIRRKALEARAKALGEGKNGKEANDIQKAIMDLLEETLTDDMVLREAGELPVDT